MKTTHFNLSVLFLLLAGCYLTTFSSSAQSKKSTKEFEKIATSESTLTWMKVDKTLNKTTFLESAKTVFNLDEKTTLKITSSSMDNIGWIQHRVQQHYNNVPIEGGNYILHEKDGLIQKANGNIIANFSNSQTVQISETEVIKKLLEKVKAEKYAWEDEGYESMLKRQQNDDNASFYPTAELVYYNFDFHNKNSAFNLCYKIDIYSIEPFERYWYYVDVESGELIDKVTRLLSNCSAGTGSTNYVGTVNISTTKVGNQFHLRNSCGSQIIATYDAENTYDKDYNNFTDSDNNWTSSYQKSGVETHWGAQKSYEYFLNNHNLRSYDGNGAEILSWVHLGEDLFNAFWDGNAMLFGDGNGSYTSLTSLDIVAHEFTHGVTQNSSNLIYRNESGALNESFSDIFGSVVEWIYDPNPSDRDWYVGEDAHTTGTGLRDMSNPNAKNHPDTYNGDHWYTGNFDNGGVHRNSGVQNFWFFLLVEGGNGTNDMGTSYNVQGIGLSKAAKIAYRNLTVYLTRYSTYDDAKEGAIQAASDLYGANSNEVTQVRRAWCAVGAGDCSAPPPPNASITVTSPNGGESLRGTHNITWNSSGNTDNVHIDYSLNRGATWLRLVETDNDGSYTWNVPDLTTDLGLVRITDTEDFSIRDESDAIFKISSCSVVADFSISASAFCANNNITFTNETTDINNPNLFNVNYKWFINGSQVASSTNLTRMLQAGGNVISLEASYSNGCKNTETQILFIKPAATADFEYGQVNGGGTVEFVADQADATSYTWTFNGTNFGGNNKMTSYIFNSSGTYNVCLEIESDCGTVSRCKNVSVNINPCSGVNANFSVPANNCVNSSSFFNNTSTGASSYTWKVNGQNTSSTNNFSYTFPIAGNYTVTLIAQNSSSCKDTRNKTVTVYSNADELNPSNDYMSCTAGNRSLNAGVASMQSYEWKLDGSIVNTNRIFNATTSGNYEITVEDRCGNEVTDYVLIALDDTECVYPGDLNFDGIVNGRDVVYLGMHYGARGYPRVDQATNFSRKASVDWGSSVFDNPNVDLKHVDADGNGFIDIADFDVISANWEDTHNAGLILAPFATTVSPLSMNIVPNGITSINGSGDMVFDINFESDADDGIALYAGYGEIDLNDFLTNSIVGSKAMSITPNNSWLVEESSIDLVYLQKVDQQENKIKYAFTCLDGRDKVGSGRIAQTLLEVINISGLDGSDEEITISGENFNSNGDQLNGFSEPLPFSIYNYCEPADILINNNTAWQSEYRTVGEIRTSNEVEIVNGDNIGYYAEERIKLNTGFSAKPGTRFKAYNSSCNPNNKQNNTEENDTQQNIFGIKPSKD